MFGNVAKKTAAWHTHAEHKAVVIFKSFWCRNNNKKVNKRSKQLTWFIREGSREGKRSPNLKAICRRDISLLTANAARREKSSSALRKQKWVGLARTLLIAQCTYVVRRRAGFCLYTDTSAYTDGLHLAGGNGTVAAEMAPSSPGYCPLQSSARNGEAWQSNQTML